MYRFSMFLLGEYYKDEARKITDHLEDVGLEEEFEEEYESECQRLFFLGKLISELEEPSPEKMEMESLRKKCQFIMERRATYWRSTAAKQGSNWPGSWRKEGYKGQGR